MFAAAADRKQRGRTLTSRQRDRPLHHPVVMLTDKRGRPVCTARSAGPARGARPRQGGMIVAERRLSKWGQAGRRGPPQPSSPRRPAVDQEQKLTGPGLEPGTLAKVSQTTFESGSLGYPGIVRVLERVLVSRDRKCESDLCQRDDPFTIRSVLVYCATRQYVHLARLSQAGWRDRRGLVSHRHRGGGCRVVHCAV